MGSHFSKFLYHQQHVPDSQTAPGDVQSQHLPAQSAAVAPAVQGLPLISATLTAANVLLSTRIFAYIICIDEYRSPRIDNLNCCVGDGDNFANCLRRKFPSTVHITRLSNEAATCENIKAALQNGPPRGLVQRDDILIFFYAGHGSRIKAPSGWVTEDGHVEVICPHDAEDGQNVIHDYDINFLLRGLAQRHSNIVLILDSCHAAGNARASRDSVPRYTKFGHVPPYDFPAEYRQMSGTLRGGSPSVENKPLTSSLPFVLLAGCGQHESAYETPPDSDVSDNTAYIGGHYTNALVKLLSEVSPGLLSYATLTKSLPKLPHQTPECVGATNRLVFSLDRASDEGLYFDIESKETSYIVHQAGSMLGITAGTVFSVRKRDNSEDLGTMTVTDVGVGFCIATAATPTTGESPIFPSAAKAYLHSWSYNDGALKISVGKGVSFPLSQAEKYAVLVESPEEADIVLSKDGTGISVERCNSLIATRTQAPRVRLGTVADQEGLSPILAAVAHFHYHLLREGKLDRFEKQITVRLHRLARTMSAMGPRWQASGSDPIEPDNESQVSLTHSDDTCYGIVLENNSLHDLYPFLFYFDPSDYTIQQLYPQRGHALPRVAPLRSNEQLPIGFGNSEVGPLEFHLNDGEQFDAGFLKLFFCTSSVKMELISQKAFGVGAKRHFKEREDYIPQSTWDAKMITICVERS